MVPAPGIDRGKSHYDGRESGNQDRFEINKDEK
jgi:hypothetical protein